MKLWKKTGCLFFVTLLLCAATASTALAAPEPQATESAFMLGDSFSLGLYRDGLQIGIWTVNSDGSWETTLKDGSPLFAGTLTRQTTTQRALFSRIDMDVEQDFITPGTATLSLYFFGTKDAALVVGVLNEDVGPDTIIATGNMSGSNGKLNYSKSGDVVWP